MPEVARVFFVRSSAKLMPVKFIIEFNDHRQVFSLDEFVKFLLEAIRNHHPAGSRAASFSRGDSRHAAG